MIPAFALMIGFYILFQLLVAVRRDSDDVAISQLAFLAAVVTVGALAYIVYQAVQVGDALNAFGP